MKNKILLLLFPIIIFGCLNAQNCTSCTTTITTFNTMPQVVPVGTTLCIAAGGEISGDLLITGGTVCNEGIISSDNIAMTSGQINNYGAILSLKFGVDGGDIHNYNLGSVNADSVGVSGNGITITNDYEWSSKYIGLISAGGTQPVWNNSGSLQTDSIGITNWTLNQSGTFVANFDLGINVNSVINNTGVFDVWRDFGIDVNASFNNSSQATIGRDLGNSGNIYNSCTIDVGEDFLNSGTVTGPTTSCGKISVAQSSLNSGSFGGDGSNIDLCDATGVGFDGNVGTIGNNVSYCNCTAGCMPLSISTIEINKVSVFPNPFSDFTLFTMDKKANYQLRIYELNGQLIQSEEFHTNQYKLFSNNLSKGIYFFRLSNDNNFIKGGKLIVQ